MVRSFESLSCPDWFDPQAPELVWFRQQVEQPVKAVLADRAEQDVPGKFAEFAVAAVFAESVESDKLDMPAGFVVTAELDKLEMLPVFVVFAAAVAPVVAELKAGFAVLPEFAEQLPAAELIEAIGMALFFVIPGSIG